MEITTNIFLSEKDVRKIVKDYLKQEGHEQIGELDIIVRSDKDIPQGATAGDCLGIKATVKTKT